MVDRTSSLCRQRELLTSDLSAPDSSLAAPPSQDQQGATADLVALVAALQARVGHDA